MIDVAVIGGGQETRVGAGSSPLEIDGHVKSPEA
jgi:hypothetical protein